MSATPMVLSATPSEQEWQARYLMILSHLNFEHELMLICLPGAADTCTWSEQQWQSLPLYGLGACYHLTDQPPIASTQASHTDVRKLISDKHQLIHICHWQNFDHFNIWLPLVSLDDLLIVIGTVNQDTFDRIKSNWPNKDCYIVNDPNKPHISSQDVSLISSKQWADLLQTHQASLTWN